MAKTKNYTYNYSPELFNYIIKSNMLNKHKHEDKILKQLVRGFTCKEIGNKLHYSERTIQNRRKDLYVKTQKYMI